MNTVNQIEHDPSLKLQGEAIKTCLGNEDIAQAEQLVKQVRQWSQIEGGWLESLWVIATEQHLSSQAKQWLTQQCPLIKSLPYLHKTRGFYEQLATYNHDLIVELSKESTFESPWYALLASMRRTATDQEEITKTWDRLINRKKNLMRGRSTVAIQFREMSDMIGQAIEVENYHGINWVMDYYRERNDLVFMVLGEGLSHKIKTVDKLKRIIQNLAIQPTNSDWQVLAKAAGEARIRAVKTAMEKDRLEQTVSQAGSSTGSKVHL